MFRPGLDKYKDKVKYKDKDNDKVKYKDKDKDKVKKKNQGKLALTLEHQEYLLVLESHCCLSIKSNETKKSLDGLSS